MKKKTNKKQPMVEIAASFSFKVNPNNHLNLQERKVLAEKLMGYDYSNADFFLSAKTTCKHSDMPPKTQVLQSFCKQMVIKAANKYIAELHEQAKSFLPPMQGKSDIERHEDAKGSAQSDL